MSTTAVRPYDLAEFVAEARRALAEGRHLRMSVEDGSDIDIPADAATAIVNVLVAINEHRRVQIATLPDEMTTGQAADVLGVSRPTVVTLIDEGRIPARKIGTHRRVRTDDVIAFMERTTSGRGDALDELTALSQDAGLY